MGTVLVSSAERIASARVWRKRYGAGMRQVGVLAAAGLHAVDHHVARLADDHARAGVIAGAVARVCPDLVDPGAVETNIVVLRSPRLVAARAVAAAREQGVLISALGPTTVRLVTHLDLDDAQAERAAAVLAAVFGAVSGLGPGSVVGSTSEPGVG